MGNLLLGEVKIKGTRPLLQHRFGPDALPLEKQEKTGVAGNDPEEWRRTAMVAKNGQLYFEATYVFSTLKEAARYTKKGRVGTIQKPLAATLQCTDDRILLDNCFLPGFPNGHECNLKTVEVPPDNAELPVYLDIRGVVNPNTKGRNVRYRLAAAAGWTCTFHILWDKTIISRGEMEAVLIDAGKLVGISNGRSIGMGRFEIVDFSVSDA